MCYPLAVFSFYFANHMIPIIIILYDAYHYLI